MKKYETEKEGQLELLNDYLKLVVKYKLYKHCPYASYKIFIITKNKRKIYS